jgi:ribonuclease MRP protein subunit RMP1
MANKKSAVRGPTSTSTNLTPLTSSKPETEAGAEGTSTSSSSSSSPYENALARLAPLQPVLAGLAHRNRNQHRRAAWWRHFGMLRRHSADLVEDLVSAVAAAQKHAARVVKAKSKKRRREGLLGTGAGSNVDGRGKKTMMGTEVDEDVARRATWLRDVLVPKWYL